MPRKSPGHDSRMITYRTLPGSSTRYQRVNVGECTAWVQTNLEFCAGWRSYNAYNWDIRANSRKSADSFVS
jgi:hypothetical protein